MATEGFAARLRELRGERGWTQAELAEQSGVPQADISRIENGRLDARWSTLQRLLAALAGAHTPRRSLANGRRVTTAPAPSSKWTPPGGRRTNPSPGEVSLRLRPVRFS